MFDSIALRFVVWSVLKIINSGKGLSKDLTLPLSFDIVLA
jgi:hypothetical protein